MAYKYIPAGYSITNVTPKDSYVNQFQETLYDQFYNSTNWWTVEKETFRGSQLFEEIDVRIAHVINAETGLKLGDDWKTLMNKDLRTQLEVGMLYRFDNNYWILVNTEYLKNLGSTATLRRCNNTLRWIDETTGAYYEEPCAIDYQLKEPRDYSTAGSSIVTPSAYMIMKIQQNDRTHTIRPNQRFLFGRQGNWTAFKTIGSGYINYLNTKTFDNLSNGIIELNLVANYVNDETDDIVNGIADVQQNLYTLTFQSTSMQLSPLQTYQLVASVTYNGNTATRDLVWSTSNPLVATVDTNGLVTAKGAGSCTITATIEGNSASDDCTITVSNTPSDVYVIEFTPNTNYVLEGEERTYTVTLKKNGVAQGNTFTFSYDNAVPYECFIFTSVDGNHFKIKNLSKYPSSPLTVTCTTTTPSATKDIEIWIKGSW